MVSRWCCSSAICSLRTLRISVGVSSARTASRWACQTGSVPREWFGALIYLGLNLRVGNRERTLNLSAIGKLVGYQPQNHRICAGPGISELEKHEMRDALPEPQA